MSLQRVYYISMEYYMGRSLTNAMVNLGIDSEVEEAIYEVSCWGVMKWIFWSGSRFGFKLRV